jgi:hypothetical protein
VASGSGGSTSPSLVERLEEPNLRRLLEEVVATASLLKHTLNHLLAATAGQVGKGCRRRARAAEAALDEDLGAGCLPLHPPPLPLATEAGRKRRGRRRQRSRPTTGTAHTHRIGKAPATSKTVHRRITAPPPQATTAGQRKVVGKGVSREEEAADTTGLI